MHHVAKEVYEPVIVATQFDQTTGDLEVWAVSDLWDSVSGHATITWYDWTRKVLLISKSNVNVRAVNATRALERNVRGLGLNLSNVIAKCSIEAQRTASDSKAVCSTKIKHETWFHPEPLAKQTLMDPQLSLRYDHDSSTFVC